MTDRMRAETAFARMLDASGHSYLENERAIPSSVFQSDRFTGRVRIDARGNTVFPHFDREGICGYEIKNLVFSGFGPGGSILWGASALIKIVATFGTTLSMVSLGTFSSFFALVDRSISHEARPMIREFKTGTTPNPPNSSRSCWAEMLETNRRSRSGCR